MQRHQTREDKVHVVPQDIHNHKNIHRITLCVSNDCNLRCKYCYAHGGSYGSKRHLMTEETANQFVNFCAREFEHIDRILFFGGEPLLNWRIISLVCSSFEKMANEGKTDMPLFSLITNGTLISPEILSVIKRYITNITVSIDGDKVVNDANRTFPDGTGSFERIASFIKTIKELGVVDLEYEATFTTAHLRNKRTRFGTKQYLTSTFGIDGMVVDVDSLDKEDLLNYIENLEMRDLAESDFECLPQDFWKILDCIVAKKNNEFCSILRNRFVVTTRGDIIGCQMLMNRPGSVAGSIFETQIPLKLNHAAKNFKDNESCNNCWCKPLCGGCCIDKFYDKTNGYPSLKPNADLCVFTRRYIEAILILIYKLKSNNEMWKKFLSKCQRKYS